MQIKRHLVLCALAASAGLAVLSGPAMAQQQSTPGVGVNYETRLSEIEDEMRGLNGRIEQLDFGIRRLDQTLQHMQLDTDTRLTKLETAAAAAPPQPQPAATNVAPAQGATHPDPLTVVQDNGNAVPVDGTLGAVKLRDGKIVGGINNPQSPPLPQAPPDYGLTPQEQYDRAFGLLRQADYDNAEKAFKSFIDKNPKDKLLDNAKYWYGETLYVRGRFDESAVAFADAYQQNPQGSKAPDSLLKLAMSLSAIDKNADACTTLSELRSKYPNAAPSIRSRADEQRQKLKCGRG